jgi:hypothetical protein
MKSKKARPGSKKTSARKLEKELSLEESVKEFTTSQKLPPEFSKMFAELGINSGKDDCGGNCIPCKKKVGCETFIKIKDCFTGRS